MKEDDISTTEFIPEIINEENAHDERQQTFGRHCFSENKRCNRVKGNIGKILRYLKNTEERGYK